MSSENQQSTSGKISNFASSLARHTWIVGGGLGGFAGAVLWGILTLINNKFPEYAEFVVLLLLSIIVVTAFYHIWKGQNDRISDLLKEQGDLQAQLRDDRVYIDIEEFRLTDELNTLAKEWQSLDQFIGKLTPVLKRLRALRGFTRVAFYSEQDSVTKSIENITEITVVHDGQFTEFKADREVFRIRERTLVASVRETRRVQTDQFIESSQRYLLGGGIPVMHSANDDFWGVLVVYQSQGGTSLDQARFRIDLEELHDTFVRGQLVRAFENVSKTETWKQREDYGISRERFYAVLQIKYFGEKIEANYDPAFVHPENVKGKVVPIINDEKNNLKGVLMQAIQGESSPTGRDKTGKYSLSILPIPDSQSTKHPERVLAILDSGPLPIKDISSNLETLADLFGYLSCGLRDPETGLYSRPAFHRHIEKLLKATCSQNMGVFLIEAKSNPEQSKGNLEIADALRNWAKQNDNKAWVMVARYDPYLYALILPVEDAVQSEAISIALEHSLKNTPSQKNILDGVFMGIVFLKQGYFYDAQDVLLAVTSALTKARAANTLCVVEEPSGKAVNKHT